MEIIFYFCISLVAYPYTLHPLLLFCWSRFCQPVRPAGAEDRLPALTILIPAYNEEACIADKIRNVLAADYPRQQLEIVVANDGSTDRTLDILDKLSKDYPIKIKNFSKNIGKINVLNAVLPSLGESIVVHTDASAMLRPDALRRLAVYFADPAVGAVSGLYRLRPAGASEAREDFYWKLETAMKAWEARIDSTLGAHGALYALRANLFAPLPPGTINDDFLIPIGIRRQGYRVLYEPQAISEDEEGLTTGFGRRVRIMRGNWQQLHLLGDLLNPPQPWLLFFFTGRKLLRLIAPFFMALALACHVSLLGTPFWNGLMVLHVLFYLMGMAGFPRPVLLYAPHYFLSIQAAGLVAVWQILRGRQTRWR